MDFTSLLEWKAEGMRFSLFTNVETVGHDVWWTSFTDLVPATTTHRPAISEYVYNGEFAQGILDLRVLPDRIDWIYSPAPAVVPDMPSIGLFHEQSTIFINSLRKWLNAFNGHYTRAAFSTTILNDTKDRSSGYEVLNHLLPFMPLSAGDWQDFFLQFNKPITVTSPSQDEVKLNRLINYSVAKFQIMTINKAAFTPVNKHYTRVEFDINTIADYTYDFDKHHIEELVSSLTDIVGAARSASEV
ncbi:hypothetical protein ACOZ12_001627 [Cronobacter turicensis]